MKKITNKLSKEESDKLTADFLKELGRKLAKKRKKASISQQELANCISVDRSLISKYENGLTDIGVSKLPLISLYCNFPLSDLFPKKEPEQLVDILNKAIAVTVEKDIRSIKNVSTDKQGYSFETGISSKKMLTGRIYEVDGKPVIENVNITRRVEPTKRDFRSNKIVANMSPLSDEEFLEYINSLDDDKKSSIIAAGELLSQLDNTPHKNTIRNAVSSFIIDEIIIDYAYKNFNTAIARRLYEYYNGLYQRQYKLLKNPK